MKTIYKYTIASQKASLFLPPDAEVLDIQAQEPGIAMWVLLDPEAEKVERTFHVFSTGWEISYPNDLHYIATVQVLPQYSTDHSYAWHVFEEIRQCP